MMRTIDHIVLHCTATAPTVSVAAIQKYWRETLKWKSPGYHYLIDGAGKLHCLQPEHLPSNGVAGHNANSIHISYTGGVENGKAKDTRSPYQKEVMEALLMRLMLKYPKAKIQGHRDFPGVKKDCPSFDVAAWLKTTRLQSES